MNDALTLALVGLAVIGCAFGVLVIAVVAAWGVRASDFDDTDEPEEVCGDNAAWPPAPYDEGGRR